MGQRLRQRPKVPWRPRISSLKGTDMSSVRTLAPALLLVVALQACDLPGRRSDRDAAAAAVTATRSTLPGWRNIRFGMPARSLIDQNRFVVAGDEYSGALRIGGQAYHVTVLGVGGQVQQIAFSPDVAAAALDARQCGAVLKPLKSEIARNYGQPDSVTASPPQLGAGEVAQWRFGDGGVILASSRWGEGVCQAVATFSGAAVASGSSLTGQGGDSSNTAVTVAPQSRIDAIR